jgi:hypothetical protein
MRRFSATWLAAVLALTGVSHTAACAQSQAASPFEEVVLPQGRSSGHLLAYSSMAGGVGLVALSFFTKDSADRRYEDYLTATDPNEIDRLYDETVRLDRWSAASLISGQLLFAFGVYLRFVRPPSAPVAGMTPEHGQAVSPQLALDLGPRRWALSLRF